MGIKLSGGVTRCWAPFSAGVLEGFQAIDIMELRTAQGKMCSEQERRHINVTRAGEAQSRHAHPSARRLKGFADDSLERAFRLSHA